MSDVTLALATANTNPHIWSDDLLEGEVWTQRDQLTREQLPIVDRQLILSQNYSCQQNHTSSAKSKARGLTNLPSADVSVGDLVFLKGDRDKLKPVRNTLWSAFMRTFLVSSGSSPPSSFAANSSWYLCLNVNQWLRECWHSPCRAPFVAFKSHPHLTLVMTPTLLFYHQGTPLSLHLR